SSNDSIAGFISIVVAAVRIAVIVLISGRIREEMGYPNSRSALYKETAIHTASPTKLVVMLYEGAVRFLTRAASDIRNRDLVSKAESVSRALAIIQHLRLTLDMDKGQDIARQLDRIYEYAISRVVDGST